MLWTVAHQAPLSMGFSGKNTGAGCHALLQGIFPIQGSNPGLPHGRQILYWLSHQESPRIQEWIARPSSRGLSIIHTILWLPWWLSGKEPTCTAVDLGLIHGSGRSPGEEDGNPLQYSYLENSMDRGGWRATFHRVSKSLTLLSE